MFLGSSRTFTGLIGLAIIMALALDVFLHGPVTTLAKLLNLLAFSGYVGGLLIPGVIWARHWWPERRRSYSARRLIGVLADAVIAVTISGGLTYTLPRFYGYAMSIQTCALAALQFFLLTATLTIAVLWAIEWWDSH